MATALHDLLIDGRIVLCPNCKVASTIRIYNPRQVESPIAPQEIGLEADDEVEIIDNPSQETDEEVLSAVVCPLCKEASDLGDYETENGTPLGEYL